MDVYQGETTMKINTALQIGVALTVLFFAGYAQAQTPNDQAEIQKIWHSLTPQNAPDCMGFPSIPPSIFQDDGTSAATLLSNGTINMNRTQSKAEECATEVRAVIQDQAEKDKASTRVVNKLVNAVNNVIAGIRSAMGRSTNTNIDTPPYVIGIRG
jgi:hypothetical protein